MNFDNVDHIQPDVPEVRAGLYLATVVSVLDPTFMGMFSVRLERSVGNTPVAGQLMQVKYMSPFYGSTSSKYVADSNDYNNTQKSYGMWMIPPDTGTVVMVAFADDNPKYGYWIGCIPDEAMNFMVPGIAATEYVVDGIEKREPVAEYNKIATGQISDPTKALKPKHPFAKTLATQGLGKDDTRGITTSSARREAPSMVFGISTPGPIDKQDGAKKGRVGPADSYAEAYVSRLGGSTFVMDDGDDKFLRKLKAEEGPPEYASLEQGDTGGLTDIPHNELIRLRTRTGHQILLHNSEDLIYIGNARGTTWIELTSNGKIDIFAEDSISIHTKNDLNINADRDINIEAGRNFNVKAKGKVHTEAGQDTEIIAGKDTLITSGANSHIKSATTHRETAGKIYMNSALAATAAKVLSTFKLLDQTGKPNIESIMLRVPTHEPWPHHENLDPMNAKIDKTDREAGEAPAAPANYNKYSTTTDTFKMYVPPNSGQGGNA